MTKAFIWFLIIQTLALNILCGITIYALLSANFDWFLPFDLLTLIIAVMILSLLILVTGYGSAISNTFFPWALFHLFMGMLFIVELLTSWFSSDVDEFLALAQKTWNLGSAEDVVEMQDDISCCGFNNVSDRPFSVPCPFENAVCCKAKLMSVMNFIRDTASVALFTDFMFAMFIDFAGCAICFHPDIVTLEDQIQEEALVRAESMNEFGLKTFASRDEAEHGSVRRRNGK